MPVASLLIQPQVPVSKTQPLCLALVPFYKAASYPCTMCCVWFGSRADLEEHYRIAEARIHPKCEVCGEGAADDIEHQAVRTCAPQSPISSNSCHIL